MITPQCHTCLSAALPFAVQIKEGKWYHACGAVVCPACGGAPADGDALCGACRALAGSIHINAADVVSIGTAGMSIAADRIQRGRRRVR